MKHFLFMNKTLKIVLSGVIVFGLAGVGGYAFLVRPTKGPSQQASNVQNPPNQDGRPPVPPLAEASPSVADPVPVTEGQALYRIVSEESKASFELDEVLRGEPKTVIGVNQGHVSGEIAVDRTRVASSTIGAVRVNARTFVTDSDQRNNAIRRFILKTEDDANEFIVFAPTTISGSSTLTIDGDLTISGITKPASFTANVSFAEDGTLTAHATSVVKRDDFNLAIPNIPFVANVEEDVELSLDLVAKPVTE